MNYKLEEDGFSLIEILIAMAIFVFIIGGIVMFSVNSIKANTRSQAMQETMENARFAMDDLAKKLRTSSNITPAGSGDEIFFIDNKTLIKYCYKFVDNKMMVGSFAPTISSGGSVTAENAAAYNNIVDCDSIDTNKAVVGDDSGGDKIKIGGKFEVMSTDIESDNPHRGFVRIVIDMVYNDDKSPDNRAEMHLQSGVSIVDYEREDEFKLETTI